MSSRTRSTRDRRARRARRWPLTGACLWLLLMTLFGAEVAGGERTGQGAFPDEGYGQGEATGQTDRRPEPTGL